MTLNIQSPDSTLKQEVIDFLNQKLNMLSRRYNEIISVDASFRLEKSSANANKFCEIRLIISGYDLIASAQCKTFEAAISKTSEALERQIEKRKTKHLSAK
jgi:putative sigma-54 modulation protein